MLYKYREVVIKLPTNKMSNLDSLFIIKKSKRISGQGRLPVLKICVYEDSMRCTRADLAVDTVLTIKLLFVSE